LGFGRESGRNLVGERWNHRCQLARTLDFATVVTRGMSAIPSMAAARMAAGVMSLTGHCTKRVVLVVGGFDPFVFRT
jgi:hypothetical protein